MEYVLPLATSSWNEKEMQSLQDVISRGMFTMDEKVLEFEKEFAKYNGSNYCVMVNSGSSANLLMVASLFFTNNNELKLSRGDEVVVPAIAWSTTYSPLQQYGLKLKIVDVDLHTLNYNLDDLENAITENTKLIMVVNILGNPNDYDRLADIISKKNPKAIVIEDCCESLGAEFHGYKTGTFGIMGSYSCFFSHHISTMEGGLIVTDEEELYHILLTLRSHGWTRNLPKHNKICEKSSVSFEESYRFILPGYNVRPLEMSGAVGLEQLKKLPSMLRNRRQNAKVIYSLLENNPLLYTQREIGNSSWFGFSLLVKPDTTYTREKLIDSLDKLGFQYRPIVSGNFTKNDVMKYYDYEIFGNLKNAKYIDANGLFIGNHHYSIEQELKSLKLL